MRNSILLVILPLFLLSAIACNNAEKNKGTEKPEQKETVVFPFKRGINMSHWVSQIQAKGEARRNMVVENDFGFLAYLGYDHVRLPIDEEHLFLENGEKDPEAWVIVHNAINWSKKHNMRIILDLHKIKAHGFSNKSNPLFTDENALEHFVGIWLKMSEEFSRYPTDQVAYELLNETVADDAAAWNRVLARAIEEIRKKEPNRKLIVGSNSRQSAGSFEELELPADPNLILGFHFYRPYPFTHYLAHWGALSEYKGLVQYPGEVVPQELFEQQTPKIQGALKDHMGVYNIDTLEKHMLKAVKVAKEKGLQLYCGEFGTLPTVDRQQRLQWYRDMASLFEKHNISWANWDYKGGFAIFDAQTGRPDCGLIKALLGECTLERLKEQ